MRDRTTSSRHPMWQKRLRHHHEKVVARDVLVEVDSAGVHLYPLACPWRRLSPRVVDLAVDLVQPVRLLTSRRRRGVDREERPTTTKVGRERDPPVRRCHFPAAVELERHKPGERERPA